MKNEISAHKVEVRMFYIPLIQVCLYSGIILFLAIGLREQFNDLVEICKSVLFFEVVMLPCLLLMMVGITKGYRVNLFSDGISSYDPFGSFKLCFMRFDAMDRVKMRSVFGCKFYYVISEDGNNALWIPIALNDKEQFVENLGQCVANDHVLLQQLRQSDDE